MHSLPRIKGFFYLFKCIIFNFGRRRVIKEAGWSTKHTSDLHYIVVYDLYSCNILWFINEKNIYFLTLKFDFFAIYLLTSRRSIQTTNGHHKGNIILDLVWKRNLLCQIPSIYSFLGCESSYTVVWFAFLQFTFLHISIHCIRIIKKG